MVTFKNILDRVYTTLFTDYKLDNLVQVDEQAFYDFLGGFLVNSIDMFDGCLSDLSYHSTSRVIEKDNIWYSMWIETRDGRRICTGQFLLKDDRRKRIISFDQTIFYDFYDIWST